jgi:hypothetical protein
MIEDSAEGLSFAPEYELCGVWSKWIFRRFITLRFEPVSLWEDSGPL